MESTELLDKAVDGVDDAVDWQAEIDGIAEDHVEIVDLEVDVLDAITCTHAIDDTTEIGAEVVDGGGEMPKHEHGEVDDQLRLDSHEAGDLSGSEMLR